MLARSRSSPGRSCSNSVRRHAGVRDHDDFRDGRFAAGERGFHVAFEQRGKWFLSSFHSGCCGASTFTRSSAKRSWKYIGCSAQSVPSLSKVAMRSLGGTKSDEPSLVTFSTKAMIAFFGAVVVPRRERVLGVGGGVASDDHRQREQTCHGLVSWISFLVFGSLAKSRAASCGERPARFTAITGRGLCWRLRPVACASPSPLSRRRG